MGKRPKRWGRLLAVLGVLAALTFVILHLSSRIQAKLEASAAANIQGTVQLIADSASAFQNGKVNGVYQLGAALQMDVGVERALREAWDGGLFFWAAVVDASTGEGICFDGSPFRAADLACEDTALSGEKSVSDAHINSQGSWAFTVQCPIYGDGTVKGALYADISLEQFSEVLPASLYNGGGSLYLLDKRSRRFILQPVSTDLHVSARYDLRGFLSDFGELDAALEQEIFASIDAGKKQIVHITFDGAPSYLFFWPVERTVWYLCGIVPEASIQQESTAVGHTINLVAAIAFSAAAAVLWALYLSSRRELMRTRREEQYRIALFRGIAASIHEAVLMYDCTTGKRELAFDNLQQILGADVEEFEMFSGTEDFRARFADTDFERVVCRREFGEQKNSSQKLEWTNPKTGQKQWLRVDILYIELGGDKKCVVSLDDFTKEEALQDSLRTAALAAQNANQIKSRFLSSMSHEIRTPLNAVSGMLQIARRRLAEGGDISDCLEKAEGASRQLLTLIDEVLDLSKIESGKMLLEEKWFRLDELIRDVRNTMEVWAVQRRQQFQVDCAGCEGLELLGDPARLSQILLNLLSNAFKYTPEGGHIALRVRRGPSQREDSQQFTFLVEDDGYGMSEAFQKRVFLPFEQETNDGGRKESGTGLGLSIVNNLVSLMGGFFKLDSELGKGTVFKIALTFRCNAVSYVAEQADRESASPADFTGQRVLLADDNMLNREIAREFLVMAHAEVVCAKDGRAAFERFRCTPEGYFDFILMDMQMPVWDGLEATRQIRALPRRDAKTVIIIAATANAFSEDREKCLSAGMDDYISKPLDMGKLYQIMKKHRGTDI